MVNDYNLDGDASHFSDDYERAKQILKKYKQEHLLMFFDELDLNEKKALVTQICSIDFEQIFNLYEASKINEVISNDEIEPLSYSVKSQLSREKIDFYQRLGDENIVNQKCGVVTLAGGQGTRLGYKGPKGTFELDTIPKKSLFEIFCDNLKLAKEKYGVFIPWYIMTSVYNDSATKRFFEEKNYFGYPKEYIFFFNQHELPLIDVSGNLILEELYKVKQASNGNGDVFASMYQHGILEDMKQRNLEWIFFAGIDNVILNVIDPLFLGLTINHKKQIGSKTLFKKNADDLDWIFARRARKTCYY